MPQPKNPPPLRAWLPPFLLVSAIWGCSFLFIKLGLEWLTPVGIAFARISIGAVVLLAISAATRTRLPRNRTLLRHMVVVALLLNVLPGLFFAWAETRIDSALAGVINAGTPLFAALFTLVSFRDERLSRTQGLGLLAGFGGIVLLSGAWEAGASDPLGVAAAIGAVVCYGLAYPYIRHFVSHHGVAPLPLAATQVSIGALIALPIALVAGTAHADPTPAALAAMLALGTLGSGVAYIINFALIRDVGPTAATLVGYVMPIFSVLAGFVVLGETLALNQLVGGAIVVGGIALSRRAAAAKGRSAARGR